MVAEKGGHPLDYIVKMAMASFSIHSITIFLCVLLSGDNMESKSLNLEGNWDNMDLRTPIPGENKESPEGENE